MEMNTLRLAVDGDSAGAIPDTPIRYPHLLVSKPLRGI